MVRKVGALRAILTLCCVILSEAKDHHPTQGPSPCVSCRKVILRFAQDDIPSLHRYPPRITPPQVANLG
jgi:cytidine deaminase